MEYPHLGITEALKSQVKEFIGDRLDKDLRIKEKLKCIV